MLKMSASFVLAALGRSTYQLDMVHVFDVRVQGKGGPLQQRQLREQGGFIIALPA
jgi:hypothetical protein